MDRICVDENLDSCSIVSMTKKRNGVSFTSGYGTPENRRLFWFPVVKSTTFNGEIFNLI